MYSYAFLKSNGAKAPKGPRHIVFQEYEYTSTLTTSIGNLKKNTILFVDPHMGVFDQKINKLITNEFRSSTFHIYVKKKKKICHQALSGPGVEYIFDLIPLA
jgi:hypothetical protein